MRTQKTQGSVYRAASCLIALALVGGCASKPKSALNSRPSPSPNRLDLTDIRSYGRDLKHKGIVNKQLVGYLVGTRQYVLALKHTETLLKKDSNDAELHFLKGYALRELDRYEVAVKEFKAAAKFHRNYAEAWNALGVTYDRMRKPDEAEKAFLQALKITPTSPKYLNNLGFSYFSRGQYDKSVEAYKKALASYPNNVLIHNNLGFAYGMLGRYEEAMAEFKQAGRDEVAYNNQGFVYHMLGYNDQAKVMYAKALESNPKFTKARDNLRILENEGNGASSAP